jgi:hypothetical protein
MKSTHNASILLLAPSESFRNWLGLFHVFSYND